MASVVDGCHAALFVLCLAMMYSRGVAAHVVAVVATVAVVGHEPGVCFSLELASRGEDSAMEGRAPAPWRMVS